MKRIGILLCCIVLCLLFPEKVHAEEIVSEKEPVDIIFVIDCSGSMKTNDVSRMGLSMVQAFVDTVQAEDIRIGYVAYNDSILSYSAPKSIALAEEREALKEEIGAITYSRDTDIGLGVSYACELLSAEKNTRKIMVLISEKQICRRVRNVRRNSPIRNWNSASVSVRKKAYRSIQWLLVNMTVAKRS